MVERQPPLEAHCRHPERYTSPSLRLSLHVLLLICAIHKLYGQCYLNPLTSDEQTLANELMKGGFKISGTKEIKAKKKATLERKKRKRLNTPAVD